MDGFKIDSMPDLPPPREREAIRIAAGLSEEQLGRLVGVSDLSIRIWESGWEEPSGLWAMSYSRVLANLAASSADER